MFGLLLFLSGAFKGLPTVLVGVVPVLAIVALIASTVWFVRNELRDIVAVDNNDHQRTDMAVQSPNGDCRVMNIRDFKALYEPTHQPANDPLLAQQGFQTFQSTTMVLGHRISPDDMTKRFPAGRFVSRSGAPAIVGDGQYIVMNFPQRDFVDIIGEAAFKNKYKPATAMAGADRTVVSQAKALAQWDAVLRLEGKIYTKFTSVHAKLTTKDGTIDTIVDGRVEASHRYSSGDFVVIGSRGGRYPMSNQVFSSRYDTKHAETASETRLTRSGFKKYSAKGKVGLFSLVLGARSTKNGTSNMRRDRWTGVVTQAHVRGGCGALSKWQTSGKLGGGARGGGKRRDCHALPSRRRSLLYQ